MAVVAHWRAIGGMHHDNKRIFTSIQLRISTFLYFLEEDIEDKY